MHVYVCWVGVCVGMSTGGVEHLTTSVRALNEISKSRIVDTSSIMDNV